MKSLRKEAENYHRKETLPTILSICLGLGCADFGQEQRIVVHVALTDIMRYVECMLFDAPFYISNQHKCLVISLMVICLTSNK